MTADLQHPREYTAVEVRTQFLDHIRATVGYWAGERGSNVPADYTCRQRLDGLAFSILSAIDGCATALPAFILAPDPHPDDKACRQREGQNWYPENHASNVACDVAGGLHEHL